MKRSQFAPTLENTGPTLQSILTLSTAKQAALDAFHDHGGGHDLIAAYGNGGLKGFGPAYFGLSPRGGGDSAA